RWGDEAVAQSCARRRAQCALARIAACGRWMMVDYQVPGRGSGELSNEVLVNPGAFIFGELDGVLVIPQARTLEVLEECERIIGSTDVARGEFARGGPPVEVFERHKRL
ncbi:MAG: hypothetical protein ACRECQ_09280, partial [Burkholderiaceae bacterium]